MYPGEDVVLRAQGEDKELQAQKELQDAIKELANTALAALDSSAVADIFDTTVTDVTTQVTAGDACNTKFSPNLISAASLFMSAISNPTGAVLSGLQILMNNVAFLPPGLGLPSIDLDLGFDLDLPDLNLPSFDLKLGIGGGLDISSLLDSAAGLFAQPPISGCDIFLPDVGPGAEKIYGKLPGGIKQGQSGGLSKATAALGNKFIKNAFDKDGNPIQTVLSKGVNANLPRIPIRTQADPALKAIFDYPEYTGPGLHANDDTVPPLFRFDDVGPEIETLAGELHTTVSKMKEKVEDPVFQAKIKAAAKQAKEDMEEAMEKAKPELEVARKKFETLLGIESKTVPLVETIEV